MAAIIPIDTPSLGDRSYLAHDGEVALVVDPQRDIDRVLEVAAREGVRITHIVETHIHNDYVTGGLALAQRTGAKYHVNGDDPVSFERVPVRDGDTLQISPAMTVRVIATPGHTFTHLAYVLSTPDGPDAVFTGGSLLYGSTGRPDLLGPDHTHTLAHHQYASAQRLASELADEAVVLPTHGFGSFCSATQSAADSSTIGRERTANPVLTQAEQEYVDALIAGLDVWPAYYAHMGAANLAGPSEADLSAPTPATKEAIARSIEAGEWVVDLRTRVAFAKGHAPGTINAGLDGQFATYLGWLIPWGTPVTLLGESAEQVAEAQRELVRIGIDRLAGAATGQPSDWTTKELATLPRANFLDLADVLHHREVVILDIRREQEWQESHIEGAVHFPMHEIITRFDELPDGELWVHCRGGYRASVAGSILAARGRKVVVVDDSFDHADLAHLPVIGVTHHAEEVAPSS